MQVETFVPSCDKQNEGDGKKNMMTFESSNSAGLYEQQDIFYSVNGNSELCKTFLTQIMFFFFLFKGQLRQCRAQRGHSKPVGAGGCQNTRP